MPIRELHQLLPRLRSFSALVHCSIVVTASQPCLLCLMNSTLSVAFLLVCCCFSCAIPVRIAAVMSYQCLTWMAQHGMPSRSPMSSALPAPNIRRIGICKRSVRIVASSRSARSPFCLFGFDTACHFSMFFMLRISMSNSSSLILNTISNSSASSSFADTRSNSRRMVCRSLGVSIVVAFLLFFFGLLFVPFAVVACAVVVTLIHT